MARKGFALGSRFWILGICILLGYGGICYRLVDLHVVKAPQLSQELERHRYRVIPTEPRRGDIVDINGQLLATSQTFLDVGLDPSLVKPDDVGKLPEVARILEMPLSETLAAFGVQNGRLGTPSQERWRLLRKQVSESRYKELQALKIRCLYGNRSYKRVYPKSELASHLIGYVRDDGQAVAGVERTFDFYLNGQRGWREAEMRGSSEMPQFRRRMVPAENGMQVMLTIDAYTQHIVEEELSRIAESMKPEWASIIVSDPYSGETLALANYPSFDPNRYSEYELDTHKNRAVTDPVEPGSTFKIVAASGVLEEHLARTSTEFDCSIETLRMEDGYMARLPRDSHPNGILSVEDIVAKSSNRGAAQLAALLGKRGFYRYVERFGFGQKTGFEIGDESRGILHPVERWDGLTLTRMPMGHAIGATPLQIHLAMASIANGGILMRPQIVARVSDERGASAFEMGPLPKRRVVSYETARTVSALLEKTVSPQGTANVAAIPGYRVAGKTGTTQKIVNGRYSTSEHVGSFSGFFPANEPRLVITVVVDGAEVPGVAYGGRVAAPSFRRIASKLIPYYAISPSRSGDAFAAIERRAER